MLVDNIHEIFITKAMIYTLYTYVQGDKTIFKGSPFKYQRTQYTSSPPRTRSLATLPSGSSYNAID